MGTLRENILNEWHQLWLKLSDRDLAEEAKRIDMSGREAFGRLMGIPQPLAMLGDSLQRNLALQDGNAGYPLQRQSSPRDGSGSYPLQRQSSPRSLGGNV